MFQAFPRNTQSASSVCFFLPLATAKTYLGDHCTSDFLMMLLDQYTTLPNSHHLRRSRDPQRGNKTKRIELQSVTKRDCRQSDSRGTFCDILLYLHLIYGVHKVVCALGRTSCFGIFHHHTCWVRAILSRWHDDDFHFYTSNHIILDTVFRRPKGADGRLPIRGVYCGPKGSCLQR